MSTDLNHELRPVAAATSSSLSDGSINEDHDNDNDNNGGGGSDSNRSNRGSGSSSRSVTSSGGEPLENDHNHNHNEHSQRSRDRERGDGYNRDKGSSSNGGSKDDKGDRDRGRDRRSRDSRDRKDRDRDRDKDRDRDRDRDRERSRRSRSRSRSRDRKRSRSRDRGGGGDRDRRRKEEKEQDELRRLERRKKAEINELTKDQRTIFVNRIVSKVGRRELEDYFDKVGRVKDVSLPRDKQTNRHKGFAYVEMEDLDSVPACLLLHEIVPDFQKYPIEVKPSEAEKNFNAKFEKIESKEQHKRPPQVSEACKVYIGNIHVDIVEDQLREIIELYGPVDKITIHRDERGLSKGFAFVNYKDVEGADLAKAGLGSITLLGRTLKVGAVKAPGEKEKEREMLALAMANGSGFGIGSAGGFGFGGYQAASSSSNDLSTMYQSYAPPPAPPMITVPAPSMIIPLPPIHAANANANSNSNAISYSPSSSSSYSAVPTNLNNAMIPPIKGEPSTCITLKNMFDASTMLEEYWDEDIKLDVVERCQLFGEVEDCYVETGFIQGGLVYVKMKVVSAANQAAHDMHGKSFDGKYVIASFIDPSQYSNGKY